MRNWLRQHLNTIAHAPTPAQRGQSMLELALVLPILLLLLVGMVEIVVFISRYLDLLDLTREAARFGSQHDPQIPDLVAGNFPAPGNYDCSATNSYNFFYDTACVFAPPSGSTTCQEGAFCNGMNNYIALDLTTDDVVITVFTVNNHAVSNVWPAAGYWALSDYDTDLTDNANWTKDCHGNVIRTHPYYTASKINSVLEADAPSSTAFVAVEVFYCYHQVLDLPVFTNIVPDPIQIDAYSLMPIPAANPTPTP
jgi:hypothetical protein